VRVWQLPDPLLPLVPKEVDLPRTTLYGHELPVAKHFGISLARDKYLVDELDVPGGEAARTRRRRVLHAGERHEQRNVAQRGERAAVLVRSRRARDGHRHFFATPFLSLFISTMSTCVGVDAAAEAVRELRRAQEIFRAMRI
jgi:hypothetical protein